MNFPQDLMIGDTLLYGGSSLVDLGIKIDEGDDTSHIETYAGNGMSWASRNGIGVALYPFRADGLIYIRRNKGIFDYAAVNLWFNNGIRGIKYGWGDIIADLEADELGTATTDLRKCDGVDCSHFHAAVQQVAGTPHFDEIFPKNKIKPRDAKLSLGSVQIFPYPLWPARRHP